jgi:hypothetical protein
MLDPTIGIRGSSLVNDRLHYDQLVDDALRGVVRRVLADVASNGLPGAHHFYVSFKTAEPGVEIPEYLRSKYPEDMTIVLQHRYWGLEVGDDAFEVTVSFNRQNERLRVPFAALTAFVDPSVRFGLQFEQKKSGTEEDKAAKPTPVLAGPAARPQLASPATADDDKRAPAAEAGKAASPAKTDAAATPAKEGSKIVALDAFRKK